MININNKTISSVFSGEKTIEKIFKGTLKVYEAWRNLIASGVPPLTLLKCKGKSLPNEYQQVEYTSTRNKLVLLVKPSTY